MKQGQCVLHSCDQGHEGCVNPEHLHLGTKADNNREARERGRHVAGKSFGDSNGRAKINNDETARIKVLWDARHTHTPRLTQAKIAAMFNIGRSRVGEIIRQHTRAK
jgi:hypothetical protein